MTNYFNKLDILKARRTPLHGVLLDHGFDLKKEGNGNYRITNLQGLIIKDNYWFQHSTQKSGNTIDFFTKIKKLSFHQSLKIILKEHRAEQNSINWSFSETTTSAKNYLIKIRTIDQIITEQLIQHGHVKQDYSNCICFIQKYQTNKICYIFRRSMQATNNFKGEVKNSKKEFSFEINLKDGVITKSSSEQANKVYIVEGAIDACAMATLLKIKNNHYGQIKIITTAGHPHSSLKNRIQSTQASKIIIATDMDEKGRQFANTIANMIPMTNYSIPKYNAKDPAELLEFINKKQK